MNLHNFFGAWLTALGLLSWSLPSTVSPAMAQGAARAAPLAYVSNEKSGTISIIDTRTDQVLGEPPVISGGRMHLPERADLFGLIDPERLKRYAV